MAFTETSKRRISECDKQLQILAYELEKLFGNIQVSCGKRGKADQELAYKNGASRAHYGQSPHNTEPDSKAIDFVFVNAGKCDWSFKPYQLMVIKAKEIAKRLNLKLTYGIEFKSIVDAPHIELTNWKQFKV